ncbi:hypothetical protein D9758_013572 [Tetrapyrgos nigripes]|uniref:Uncharacterized protein n=1 Tax=Tetrapyrgos nigripes TaxID=182062 RepID=A0A8H5CEV8_9AGAR|nr:hypothetical protein D9758_013572 [Tetrapyrgos nigripes]
MVSEGNLFISDRNTPHDDSQRILDLIKECLGGSLEKVCLLDPKAEKELSPEEGEGRFEWFLFGVSSGALRSESGTFSWRWLGDRVFWVTTSRPNCGTA